MTKISNTHLCLTIGELLTKYKVSLFESLQLRFSTFPASLTSQLAVQTVEGGLLLAIQALKEGVRRAVELASYLEHVSFHFGVRHGWEVGRGVVWDQGLGYVLRYG